jgi:hypothetical protein
MNGKLVTQGREPMLNADLARARRNKKGQLEIDHGDNIKTVIRKLIK